VPVVRVPGFQPSRNGLAFANDFPRVPMIRIPGVGIGDASRGLCGGMTFAALDLYRAKVAPPLDSSPPREGSSLFAYLVGRSFDSFDLPVGAAKFYLWMALPDADGPFGLRGVRTRTFAQEWAKVRRDLEAGQPSPLGLIRTRSLDPIALGANHQVLAYGYDLDEDGRLAIQVYDPNHSGDDDLALEGNVDRRTGFAYVAGEAPVRGFFRSNYRPRDPRRALRPS
jgi:hypothetical protein